MKEKDKIMEIISPLIREEGFSLKDASFEFENGKKSLIITIDSEDGVKIDDCARISRKIDSVLEEMNFLDENSFLIVSSPGKEK